MNYQKWKLIGFYCFIGYTALSTTLAWASHFGLFGDRVSHSAEADAGQGEKTADEQLPESAKTFAKNFTKEYLFWTPDNPDGRAARLQPFLGPQQAMGEQAGFEFSDSLQWESYPRDHEVWSLEKQSGKYRATVYAETVMSKGKEQKRVDRWMEFIFVPAGDSYVVEEPPKFTAAPEAGKPQPKEEESSEKAAPEVTTDVEVYLNIFFKDYTTGSPEEIGYHFVNLKHVPGLTGILGLRQVKDVQVYEEGQSFRAKCVVEFDDLASGGKVTIPYELHLTNESGKKWALLNKPQ